MSVTPRPREARFWDKVPLGGEGCWEWRGWRNSGGYGALSSGEHAHQRKELAHRISWEVFNGPIPPGMHVLHHCDNPPCVRPDHLFLGTQADNNADKMAKGRNVSLSRLSEDDVRAIRASTLPQKLIAPLYGISPSNVSRIRTRDIHRDVA